MSFRQRGAPSSFLMCFILFPEKTEDVAALWAGGRRGPCPWWDQTIDGACTGAPPRSSVSSSTCSLAVGASRMGTSALLVGNVSEPPVAGTSSLASPGEDPSTRLRNDVRGSAPECRRDDDACETPRSISGSTIVDAGEQERRGSAPDACSLAVSAI